MVEFSDNPASIGVVDYELSLRPRSGGELDAHELVVRQVEIVERLGDTYAIELSVVAGLDLDIDQILGADLVLSLRRDETERGWCGVVERAHWRTVADDEVHLRLVAGPALGLLSRSLRSRVFQGATVAEIVGRIVDEELGELGRTVDVGRLARDHRPRDYCVQFREDDLTFVRRILAEEGITFFFRHDESVETMVLCDGAEAFAGIDAVPIGATPSGTPPYVPVITDRAELADTESVHAFGWNRRLRPGAVRVAAWDWKSNAPERWSGETGSTERSVDVGELYVHGDERVTEGSDGQSPHDDRTPTRAADTHAAIERWSGQGHGAGNVLTFAPGHAFELEGHPHPDFDGTWALDEVRHRGDIPAAGLGDGGGFAGAQYENSFVAVRLDQPYAPRRLDKPRVYGHQIATVVGPAGEEIHTDHLGRIEVWFHWDREGEGAGEDTSCWLRVVQPWAGAGWGTMFIPRVGMQVVVSFVDGDPDRPMCIGCVYDGAHDPPWTLPDERTKSGIKSNSSPGGGGSNEFRLEDAAGSEQVYIHAQRDFDTVVEHDDTTSVGRDQSLKVAHDQTIQVDNDRKITIGGNQSIRVEGTPKAPGVPAGHSLDVIGEISLTATKTYTLSAPMGIDLVCGPTTISMTPSGITLVSGQGAMVKIDAGTLAAAAQMATQLALGPSGVASLASTTGASIDIGPDIKATSPAGSTLQIDGDVALKAAGGGKLQLSANALMSGATAECKGSAAKVTLDGNAQITGTMVAMHGGGSNVVTDAGGVAMKGAKVGINGTAMTTILAPLVKVN